MSKYIRLISFAALLLGFWGALTIPVAESENLPKPAGAERNSSANYLPRNGFVLKSLIRVDHEGTEWRGPHARLSISLGKREYAIYLRQGSEKSIYVWLQHVRMPWLQTLFGPYFTFGNDLHAFHEYALVFDSDESTARFFLDGVQKGSRFSGYPISDNHEVVRWGGVFGKGEGPVLFSSVTLTQCSNGECLTKIDYSGGSDPRSDGWLLEKSGELMNATASNMNGSAQAWKIDATKSIGNRQEHIYSRPWRESPDASKATATISGKVLTLRKKPAFTVEAATVFPAAHTWTTVFALRADHGVQKDLLALNTVTGKIAAALGDGKGSFSKAILSSIPAANDWFAIGAADSNGDGCDDLYLAKKSSEAIWVARSDCSGNYKTIQWGERRFPDAALALGNFNRDACADVVEIPPTMTFWHMIDGHCGDHAAERHWRTIWQPKVPDSSPQHVKVFDLNEDGIDDITLTTGEHRHVYFGLSNGSSSFDVQAAGNISVQPLQGAQRTSEAPFFPYYEVTDVNNDNVAELLHYEPASDSWYVFPFKNAIRPGNAAPWGFVPGTYSYQSVVTGNFLGDGSKQLIVRGKLGAEWWLLFPSENVSKAYAIRETFPVEGNWSNVGSADFDGDNADDIFAIEQEKGTAYIALARVMEPAANVALQIGSQLVAANEQGRYSAIVEGGTVKLQPEDANRTVTTQLVTVLPGDSVVKDLLVQDSPVRPAICLGFGTQAGGIDTSRDGLDVAWYKPFGRHSACKENQAFFDIDDNSLPDGACCTLPFDDILTVDEEFVQLNQRCNPGYIATGWLRIPDCDSCREQMRCRKINSGRYQLSEAAPGRYWGFGYSRAAEDSSISRSSIPVAIRHAIGRAQFRHWDVDGCIGFPVGSLFTGRTTNHCADMYFAELQYAGAPGDPPKGTPVQMFPDCRNISSAFQADPRCER